MVILYVAKMTENTVTSYLTDTTGAERSDVPIVYEFWFLCDEVNYL